MTTFHMRVYVGPTIVSGMACKFRAAGIPVMCEGTAHLHVACDTEDSAGSLTDETSARLHLLSRLRAKHGHTFCLGMRDLEIIRRMAHATESSFRLGDSIESFVQAVETLITDAGILEDK